MTKTQHLEMTCPQCGAKTTRSWPADGEAVRRAAELIKETLDCGHPTAPARVRGWVE